MAFRYLNIPVCVFNILANEKKMLLDANVILNINLHLGMQIIWQYLEGV